MKVQDILKENADQRFVRSINRLCRNNDTNAFYLLNNDETIISDSIYDATINKNPENILVIDDLTLGIAKRFPNAKITLALTPVRVPDSVYDLVKKRIEKYYSEVAHREITVIKLEEIY